MKESLVFHHWVGVGIWEIRFTHSAISMLSFSIKRRKEKNLMHINGLQGTALAKKDTHSYNLSTMENGSIWESETYLKNNASIISQ